MGERLKALLHEAVAMCEESPTVLVTDAPDPLDTLGAHLGF